MYTSMDSTNLKTIKILKSFQTHAKPLIEHSILSHAFDTWETKIAFAEIYDGYDRAGHVRGQSHCQVLVSPPAVRPRDEHGRVPRLRAGGGTHKPSSLGNSGIEIVGKARMHAHIYLLTPFNRWFWCLLQAFKMGTLSLPQIPAHMLSFHFD